MPKSSIGGRADWRVADVGIFIAPLSFREYTRTSGAQKAQNLDTLTATTTAAVPDPANNHEGNGLRQACRLAAVIVFALTIIAYAVTPTLHGVYALLPAIYFQTQDLPCLVAIGLALVLIGEVRLPGRLGAWLEPLTRRPWLTALAAAATATGITALGSFLVFHGFTLSRDEIMADFDASIFRSGHLVAPVAPEWRSYTTALSPVFLLPIPAEVGWVSAYLPGNAAFRALVGMFLSVLWAGPILVGMASVAFFGVVRRLWPGQSNVIPVAMLLFCACPQNLVTGMTSYAMNIHLTVNLLWLWLALRNSQASHAAAMGVGFAACGLHQFIFHPLFVAPFLLYFWRQQQRRLVMAYCCVYAISIGFWVSYWSLVLPLNAATHSEPIGVGFIYLLLRVVLLARDFNIGGVIPMLMNLCRFLSWEHILALPLVLAGWGDVRRREGYCRPLAEGILLTFMAMLVLLPYQGHGWGYRYLHGLIGNVCLLATYGWVALRRREAQQRGATLAAFSAATLATLFIVMPFKLMTAAEFITPYRRSVAAIQHAPADVVLVDSSGLLFADDLVRNDPFLRNRPKILSLAALTDTQLADLCHRFRVAVFDQTQAGLLGMRLASTPFVKTGEQRSHLAKLHCGLPVPLDLTN